MNDLLQKGVEAYREGRRNEARKIFIAVVRQRPDSELAWEHLYDVSNNDQERARCLGRILEINPRNETAAQLLSQLAKKGLQADQAVSPKSNQSDQGQNVSPVHRNKSRGVLGNIAPYIFIGYLLLNVIFNKGVEFIRDQPIASRSIVGLGNTALLWEKDLKIEEVSHVYVEFFLPEGRSVIFWNSDFLNSLDILTGETLWKIAAPGPRVISLFDNKLFVSSNDRLDKAPRLDPKSAECSAYYGSTALQKYNAATGEKIWEYRFEGADAYEMFFDERNIYLTGSNDHGESRSMMQVDQATGRIINVTCNRWPNKNIIPEPPTNEDGHSSTYGPIFEMRDMRRLDLDYYFFVMDNKLVLLDKMTQGPIAFIEFSGTALDRWEIDIVNQQNIVMIYLADSQQLFGLHLLP